MEKIVLTPSFFLMYNKNDITADVSPDLIELCYTDVWHGASDDIMIKLNNASGRWTGHWYPTLGDTIQAKIGYKEIGFLDCGEFTIDDIDAGGDVSSGDTVTIKGVSAPVTKEIRTGRTQAFENMHLSEIAGEIAGRHGLTLAFSADFDPYFDRVTQNNERDLAFLKRLAEDYGYAFSVRGEKMFYHAQRLLNKEDAFFVINRNNVTSYQFSSKTVQTFRKVIVPYQLPNSGEVDEESAEDNRYPFGDIWRVQTLAESRDQAVAIAKSKLAMFNALTVQGSISLPGNIYVCAGSNVKLQGFGVYDGKMQVSTSRHKLNRTGGYVMELELNALGVS